MCIVPEVGMQLSYRWQCEHFTGVHAAYVGAHNGVQASLALTKAWMTCKLQSAMDRSLLNGNQGLGREN